MKSEKLLYAIGEIDDDLVKNALSMKKKKSTSGKKKMGNCYNLCIYGINNN